MFGYEFAVDPERCVGCQSCVGACAECGTHRGVSMIHLDFFDRARTTAAAPMVCMHCQQPTCAEVCPADAIKMGEDGVVRSALKPRCVACSNCVLACPFGVPRVYPELELMMKCDMCYDRTSAGKRPMCATVCPSQALMYAEPDRIRAWREKPANEFRFGNQAVKTLVAIMLPAGEAVLRVDVADYIWREEA